MCFVFGREEKNLRNHLSREQKPKKLVSSFGLKVLGAFYSPDVFSEVKALVGPLASFQKVSDWVDIDTPGKILIFSF